MFGAAINGPGASVHDGIANSSFDGRELACLGAPVHAATEADPVAGDGTLSG